MANQPDEASSPRKDQDGTVNPVSPGTPATAPESPKTDSATGSFSLKPAAETVARDTASPSPAPAENKPAGEPVSDPRPDDTQREAGNTLPLVPSSEEEAAQHGGEDAQQQHHDPHHDDPYHQDYHHDEYHQGHDEYHRDAYQYHPPEPEPEGPVAKAFKKLSGFGNSGSSGGTGSGGSEGTGDGDEEEGGGPVKSFLDHLEDLRWMLIKVVSTLLISMIVCMVGAKYLVAVLMWPLDAADKLRPDNRNSMVVLHWGTNELARFTTNQFDMKLGTNQVLSLSIVPVTIGTNMVMALQPDAKPFDPPVKRMVNVSVLGPIDSVILMLQLALYGGLIISSPLILYFIAQFVFPALRMREKKFIMKAVAIGAGLFLAGVAFCYFLVMGVALYGTVQITEWLGFSSDVWRAEEYLGFICKFMLGMGLSFELPVIILTLVKIGLLNCDKLVRFRSYFVVGILIFAAFVTPTGDPVTMFIVAVPLWFLYEACVVIAWFWERADRKRAEEEARGGK